MALTSVTAVELVMDTPSADLPDASLASITAAADGFVINGLNNETRNVLFSVLDSGAASVVTIAAIAFATAATIATIFLLSALDATSMITTAAATILIVEVQAVLKVPVRHKGADPGEGRPAATT